MRCDSELITACSAIWPYFYVWASYLCNDERLLALRIYMIDCIAQCGLVCICCVQYTRRFGYSIVLYVCASRVQFYVLYSMYGGVATATYCSIVHL